MDFFLFLLSIFYVFIQTQMDCLILLLSKILRSFELSLTDNGFLAILRKNLNLIQWLHFHISFQVIWIVALCVCKTIF